MNKTKWRAKGNVSVPETSRELEPKKFSPKCSGKSLVFLLPPALGAWDNENQPEQIRSWDQNPKPFHPYFSLLVILATEILCNLQQACQLERNSNDRFLVTLSRKGEFLKNNLYLCPLFCGGVLFSSELVFV